MVIATLVLGGPECVRVCVFHSSSSFHSRVGIVTGAWRTAKYVPTTRGRAVYAEPSRISRS